MQFQENWPTYVLCYRYACSLKLVLLIYISLAVHVAYLTGIHTSFQNFYLFLQLSTPLR
jgi:hypothetical protein